MKSEYVDAEKYKKYDPCSGKKIVERMLTREVGPFDMRKVRLSDLPLGKYAVRLFRSKRVNTLAGVLQLIREERLFPTSYSKRALGDEINDVFERIGICPRYASK